MPDPFQAFGLSCPSGGKFYICQSQQDQSKPDFIGCCAEDPCSTGKCPSASLQPASFSESAYEKLPRQDCDDPRSVNAWYTCLIDGKAPFMGCCSVNPCSVGSCPRANLLPAKLSSNPADRTRFLNPSGTSNTPVPSPSPSNPSDINGKGGLGAGTIAGIAVGAAVLVVMVIGFTLWKCGCRLGRRHKKEELYTPEKPVPDPAVAAYNNNPGPRESLIQGTHLLHCRSC
jgi:hypothetical protein